MAGRSRVFKAKGNSSANGGDAEMKEGFLVEAKGSLTRLAAWVDGRNIAFVICSLGMITMLLWAGSYKMTAPGAEGIVPLVSNSPLIWWHFKLFGPYIGSDIIGLTEIAAAILLIAGYFKPRAGIVGGLIATLMFFITSSMVITTPGAIISVPGIPHMRYMSFLGLFLFKDVISLGVSFYLISYFGRKAIASENEGHETQIRKQMVVTP
jgi:uncharacterized membrane protein YkgB